MNISPRNELHLPEDIKLWGKALSDVTKANARGKKINISSRTIQEITKISLDTIKQLEELGFNANFLNKASYASYINQIKYDTLNAINAKENKKYSLLNHFFVAVAIVLSCGYYLRIDMKELEKLKASVALSKYSEAAIVKIVASMAPSIEKVDSNEITNINEPPKLPIETVDSNEMSEVTEEAVSDGYDSGYEAEGDYDSGYESDEGGYDSEDVRNKYYDSEEFSSDSESSKWTMSYEGSEESSESESETELITPNLEFSDSDSDSEKLKIKFKKEPNNSYDDADSEISDSNSDSEEYRPFGI